MHEFLRYLEIRGGMTPRTLAQLVFLFILYYKSVYIDKNYL